MSKDKYQQMAIRQFAMIWNYNAHVEHQYNNYCFKDYNCETEEMHSSKVKDIDRQEEQTPHVEEKTPLEIFVAQVKRIMLLAEKKNRQEMKLTARGNGGTYKFKVDGQGFCKVMDKLVKYYTPQIEDYLNGANAEAAGSIKYVCPFIGFVLDTHLYSEPKLQKSDLKSVMEEVYGKGTSATSKLSTKIDTNEAQILFGIIKEIMKNATKA